MVLEFCSYWDGRGQWTSRRQSEVCKTYTLFLTLHEEDLVFSEGIRSTRQRRTHRPLLLRWR